MSEVRFRTCGAGLFSYLCGLAEWLYCLTTNEVAGVVIDDLDLYAASPRCSVFGMLFERPSDPRVIPLSSCRPDLRTRDTVNYPTQISAQDIIVPKDLRYVHCDPAMYEQDYFETYRRQISPVLKEYMRPVESVAQRIASIKAQFEGKRVIGIHIRCKPHYVSYRGSDQEFLAMVKADVDHLMAGLDMTSTVIFLATLLDPVLSMIKASYPVVAQPYARIDNCHTDWGQHVAGYGHVVDTIVDVWTLAGCDAVWGGASNMLAFVACLNPELSVKMLPCLRGFKGA